MTELMYDKKLQQRLKFHASPAVTSVPASSDESEVLSSFCRLRKRILESNKRKAQSRKGEQF